MLPTSRWHAVLVLSIAGLLIACPANAVWPTDGAPVGVGPSYKAIRSLSVDGEEAVFVAWRDDLGSALRVRVQRLQVDGEITPGWPAEGALAATLDLPLGPVHVVPDGNGGCFVGWWNEHDVYRNGAVRVQHLLVTGITDPGWPVDGLLVAEGYFHSNGIGRVVTFEAFEPDRGGGCTVVYTVHVYGCHDPPCPSGGRASIQRVSANAILPFPVAVAECSIREPYVRAISDGGEGLMMLAYSPCIAGTGLGYAHILTGSETFAPLAQLAFPPSCAMARAADGSLVVGLPRVDYVWGSTREVILYHWNPDGSPASGSPAAGMSFANSPQWALAVDPSGAPIMLWRATASPTAVRGTRLGPDLALSPGWSIEGNLVTGSTAVVDRFAAATDGTGGAYVIWNDLRNGAANSDLYATRVLASGLVAPGVPPAGYPLCTAPSLQVDPHLVTIGERRAIALWEDTRSGTGVDVYAQLVQVDTPVPVLASLAHVEATPQQVLLEWRISTDAPDVGIERSRDGSEWSELARLLPDHLRSVRFRDVDVRPGESFGYRITFSTPSGVVHSSATWVEVPAGHLGVRAIHSSSPSRLEVEVTLGPGGPARLDLLDLAGRRLRSLDLEDLRAGTHCVALPIDGTSSGIAWLTLRQDGTTVASRVAILR